VLSKATAVLAALFMLSAMVLAIMGQRGPGSVVSGTSAPVAAPKPATPPTTPVKPLTPPQQQPQPK
jgi:preprotein translocase subunit SecG